MKIVSERVKYLIEKGIPFRLELGSGPQAEKSDVVALDIYESSGVDIVADLNEKLDLIPDNSVLELYARHTLEHIGNLIGLIEEIHRICIPGASIKIIVPHFSNTFAYSDPTHVRQFGVLTFFYFCDEKDQPERKVPNYYSRARFVIEELHVAFYRQTVFDKIFSPLLEWIVNRNLAALMFYERHLAYIFPSWEIRFSLKKPV